MGAFLAVPVGYFINLMTAERQDVAYWLKTVVAYFYLCIHHRLNRRRFDLYDSTAVNDAYKLGFLVPPIETKLESPHSEAHLHKAADEVFCYGVNSNSECLIVRVARSSNDEAEAWIYLKLANGKTYHLPPEVVHQQSGDKSVFSSGGLEMHYLSPMRRWRITYNGLLSEISKANPGEERIVHVKFGFIWVISSEVFDMTSDLNSLQLAKALAAEKWKSPFPQINHVYKIFDFYAHSGMLMGTAVIDGEEEYEMNLWGSRSRFLGQTTLAEGSKYLLIIGTAKNGSVIHIGKMSIPNIVKDLHFGYVVLSSGNLRVLKESEFIFKDEDLEDRCQDITVNFTAGLTYELEVKFTEHAASFQSSKEWSGSASFNHVDFTMNAHQGNGFVIIGKIEKEIPRAEPLATVHHIPKVFPLVVPFTEEICQLSELTGGKGSSLGKLTQICQENQKFVVPKGIIVTTASYKKFMKGNIIESVRELEDVAYRKSAGNLKLICERVSKQVAETEIPEEVYSTIETSLHREFGEELNTFRFAVRSSAVGEDTELLSAAGQMETYLGVRGMKEIIKAIKKSWASQFGFVAIQYKRRYGQVLNSPMAVVIQEMIPCETAGVMFTCDPVTSNPSFISISANYGLGESVVSAVSEPDTVVLHRDLKNELSLDSITVGNKSLKIVMDVFCGTKKEIISDSANQKCCLSEEQALKLGIIGVNVETSYCSPRDIEWGILGNEIYLFQSRPVTSGNGETDFEIAHEFNAALRCEDEYLTVHNIGEILPGAMSPLGLDILIKNFRMAFMRPRMRDREGDRILRTSYFDPSLNPWCNHVMVNVIELFFRFNDLKGSIMNACMVSVFGKLLDDEDMFATAIDRQRSHNNKMPLRGYIKLIWDFLFIGYDIQKCKKKYENYRIPVENISTAKDLYNSLVSRCSDVCETLVQHFECSFSSSVRNIPILSSLATAKGGFDTEVYSDFAALLATCTNVESADIPASIQSLVYAITENIEPQKFKSLEPKEALNWLQTSSNMASKKFKEFMSKHGYRCFKEFDLYSVPWGTNPVPLVKMLQNFAGNISKDTQAKKPVEINEIISKLHVPVTFKLKLFLKVLLPQCQRGVRERESSKALTIKVLDSWRQAYYHLAQLMVFEGRLPDTDIFFFFTVDELGELLETRSPKLISRAYHRKRLYPELDRYIFPDIMKGIPKPLNLTSYSENENKDATIVMKGIPVSNGMTKGYARVAVTLEEAAFLKPGEILITYCTDIGWSPYFPILAGVVTELGGLISHGAVVAREYGLPCIVGLHGATHTFHTGDFVLLDGNQGILKKLSLPKEDV